MIALVLVGVVVGIFVAFELMEKSPKKPQENSKTPVEAIKQNNNNIKKDESDKNQSNQDSDQNKENIDITTNNKKESIKTVSENDTKNNSKSTDKDKQESSEKKEIIVNNTKNISIKQTNKQDKQVSKTQQTQQTHQVKTSSQVTKSTKSKTKGKWYLVNYNKEYYGIDEVGDDVSEIKINDVCEENKGVTTFCDREEDLRKSSAKDLGKEVCDGGGECKVGQSCLLWYDDTQDNGDVELKTATYKCE